jgi:hypothetical protein
VRPVGALVPITLLLLTVCSLPPPISSRRERRHDRRPHHPARHPHLGLQDVESPFAPSQLSCASVGACIYPSPPGFLLYDDAPLTSVRSRPVAAAAAAAAAEGLVRRNTTPSLGGGGVRQSRQARRDCHGPMALPHSTAYKLATEHHESERTVRLES